MANSVIVYHLEHWHIMNDHDLFKFLHQQRFNLMTHVMKICGLNAPSQKSNNGKRLTRRCCPGITIVLWGRCVWPQNEIEWVFGVTKNITPIIWTDVLDGVNSDQRVVHWTVHWAVHIVQWADHRTVYWTVHWTFWIAHMIQMYHLKHHHTSFKCKK